MLVRLYNEEALDKKLNSVILKASFYYIPCVKMSC